MIRLYCLEKVNFIAMTLSMSSMNIYAQVKEVNKELIKDVYRLSPLGVWVLEFMNSGVIIILYLSYI